MEFKIDETELAAKIAGEIVKALAPLLKQTNKAEPGNDLFTVETLAKRLSVSKQWVYERVSLKEIPHIKMGHFPRFRKAEIESWLDAQKLPAVQKLSSRKPLKR